MDNIRLLAVRCYNIVAQKARLLLGYGFGVLMLSLLVQVLRDIWKGDDGDYLKPTRGLQLLAEPAQIDVDIIAVHGLDGQWNTSWMDNNGNLWLKDFLPAQIPNARIHSWAYDSRTEGPRIAETSLNQHAEDLLEELTIMRRTSKTTETPIIFIGHSLGGLVLRSTILQSQNAASKYSQSRDKRDDPDQAAIKISTHALFFFGTPFRGTEGTEPLQMLKNIKSIAGDTSDILLKHLIPNSEWLEDQQRAFSNINQEFWTAFFYEGLKTRIITGKRLMLVPKHSATLDNLANSIRHGINGDHIQMCKFSSQDDDDFKYFMRYLSEQSKNAPKNIAGRWRDWKRANGIHDSAEYRMSTKPQYGPRQFVGREELLMKIHLYLMSGKSRIVLWGLGGIGKTAIARHYMSNHEDQYASTFWIDARNNQTIRDSMLGALREIKFEYEKKELTAKASYLSIKDVIDRWENVLIEEDISAKISSKSGTKSNSPDDMEVKSRMRIAGEIITVFHRWLRDAIAAGEMWLLVFDNIGRDLAFHTDVHGSYAEGRQFIPEANGHMIFTSQSSNLALGEKIGVTELSDDAALALLTQSMSLEPGANLTDIGTARTLVNILGNHPLAIEQAGGAIEDEPRISSYIARYRDYPEQLLFKTVDESYTPVAKTFMLAFDQLSQDAAELLILCAFFDKNELWTNLLEFDYHFEDLEIRERSLQQLKQRSLIKIGIILKPSKEKCDTDIDTDTDTDEILDVAYTMHPLTQKYAQARLNPLSRQEWTRRALGVLLRLARSYRQRESRWARNLDAVLENAMIYDALQPPNSRTNSLIGHKSKIEIQVPSPSKEKSLSSGIFQWSKNWYLYSQFMLHELVERLAIHFGYERENGCGFDKRRVLWCLYHTADLAYDPEIRYSIYRWVAFELSQQYDMQYPRALEVFGSMALELIDLERYDEALEWFQWLSMARTAVLGASHPWTAGALLGQGLVLAAKERFQQAEPLLKRAYEIRLKTLGPNDSATRKAKTGYLFWSEVQYTETKLRTRTCFRQSCVDHVDPPPNEQTLCEIRTADCLRDRDEIERSMAWYFRALGEQRFRNTISKFDSTIGGQACAGRHACQLDALWYESYWLEYEIKLKDNNHHIPSLATNLDDPAALLDLRPNPELGNDRSSPLNNYDINAICRQYTERHEWEFALPWCLTLNSTLFETFGIHSAVDLRWKIGTIYENLNNWNEALDWYYYSLQTYAEIEGSPEFYINNQKRQFPELYKVIGQLHLRMENYSSAIQWFCKEIEITSGPIVLFQFGDEFHNYVVGFGNYLSSDSGQTNISFFLGCLSLVTRPDCGEDSDGLTSSHISRAIQLLSEGVLSRKTPEDALGFLFLLIWAKAQRRNSCYTAWLTACVIRLSLQERVRTGVPLIRNNLELFYELMEWYRNFSCTFADMNVIRGVMFDLTTLFEDFFLCEQANILYLELLRDSSDYEAPTREELVSRHTKFLFKYHEYFEFSKSQYILEDGY